MFGKQSHKHGGVNSLESLTLLLGFIPNSLSRKITVGAHRNMKILDRITSESRGAIKPGAAQHKRNEKCQNGEVMYRTEAKLIFIDQLLRNTHFAGSS